MSHGPNPTDDQFEIELEPTDDWSHGRPMLVERTETAAETTDGGVPSYRNTETHWWDASQVYGSTQVVEDMLRTDLAGVKIPGGKLRLTPDDLLPFNPARFPLGHDVNLAAVSGNWWVGLAMMHTLFMREHNAICDRLAAVYPEMTDDELYDHARLINAAQIAKIHTVEWTPALLSNPTLHEAMNINWVGALGGTVKKLLSPINLGEEVNGIPARGRTTTAAVRDDRGVRCGLPHAPAHPRRLQLSTRRRRRGAAGEDVQRARGSRGRHGVGRHSDVRAVLQLRHQLSRCNCVAQLPEPARELPRPGQATIDLATYDIVKCRERGVPRYNDFRRQFHMEPAKSFEDFSSDPAIVADLKRIYRHPDDVDTMVGLFAEKLLPGWRSATPHSACSCSWRRGA